MVQYLLDRGLKPSALRIGNEGPEALQNFFRENSVDFHLCPPNNHHTNQPEKTIDTSKCYFLARISGVDPNFPMHLWCCIIPQATQTLNLLCRPWINPIISVEAQLIRSFYYNRTPIAPPWKKLLIHKNPQQRRT